MKKNGENTQKSRLSYKVFNKKRNYLTRKRAKDTSKQGMAMGHSKEESEGARRANAMAQQQLLQQNCTFTGATDGSCFKAGNSFLTLPKFT